MVSIFNPDYNQAERDTTPCSNFLIMQSLGDGWCPVPPGLNLNFALSPFFLNLAKKKINRTILALENKPYWLTV